MSSLLTVDRSLTRKLLEHLGGTGEPVTRLADGDVEDQLLDLELPHGVLSLLGRHFESSYALEAAGGTRKLGESEDGFGDGGWTKCWALKFTRTIFGGFRGEG